MDYRRRVFEFMREALILAGMLTLILFPFGLWLFLVWAHHVLSN